MALDVHIADDPRRQGLTGEWPACQFEDHIHAFIFYGAGVNIYNRYPLLRRMMDFYADASFVNGELEQLVLEVDDLLPHVAANQSAMETLQRFRTLCVDAQAAGKALFLCCD